MKLTEDEYTALLAQGHVHEVGHPPRRSPTQAGDKPPAPESENRFLARVLHLAKLHGWEPYHTHDSRRSAPGFPDLILAKPGHPLLCIELKTNTGKPTMEQLQWLSVLQRVEKPQAALWRPNDWPTIVTILSSPTERTAPCPTSVT